MPPGKAKTKALQIIQTTAKANAVAMAIFVASIAAPALISASSMLVIVLVSASIDFPLKVCVADWKTKTSYQVDRMPQL